MATVLDAAQLDAPEGRRLLRRRLSELRESGYSWETAILIALHGDIDLRAACDLREAGCPEPTALRILL